MRFVFSKACDQELLEISLGGSYLRYAATSQSAGGFFSQAFFKALYLAKE